jgi:PKD repeat protein
MKRMWAAMAVLVAAGMLIAGCPSTPANKNPTAGMTVDKYILFVGGAVNFNGSTSKDSDGKVKEYTWNFGDGTSAQTTKDKGVLHTFAAAGAFSVSLQVKDDKGGKSKTVNDTVVVAPLPTASTGTTDTLTNVSFSIDTSALGGQITDYSWSFGDGTPVVKGAALSHAYADNGTFNATLTLTYKGQSASSKLPITVQNRAPKANITIGSVAPYYSNKPTTFSAASSGDDDGTVTKWAWEFGDNATDNTSTVTHAYVKPGNYTVKLTVTDNDGATGAATINIEVVKDLVITQVSIETYKDDNSIDRANVTAKFDNKGEAKTAGNVTVTVTAFKADKSAITTGDFKLSKTNTGLVDSNSQDNTMTVKALLIDNASPAGTWYWVEISYMGNVIDSGWYQK